MDLFIELRRTAFENGVQHLRGQSPRLRLLRNVIKNLLQRRVFAASKFTEPKPQQRLNSQFLLGASTLVSTRGLRIERNSDCWVRHRSDRSPLHRKTLTRKAQAAAAAHPIQNVCKPAP